MKSSPETLAARLASCFDRNQGRTQAALSRFCGVSTAAVAQWVKTGGISEENLKKAAEFFCVDEKWLLEGDALEASDKEGEMRLERGESNGSYVSNGAQGTKAIAIPECELVSLASNLEGRNDAVEWRLLTSGIPVYRPAEFFRRTAVAPVRCRAMRIYGDAMAPTVMSGDRVLFEVWEFPRNAQERRAQLQRIVDGGLYIVQISGTCRVKRLGKMGEHLRVFSDNPRYGDETYAEAALERFAICGRVIGLERECFF